MRELVDELLSGDREPKSIIRPGIVSSDDPLEVTLLEQDGLSASRLNSYGNPTIGDPVLCLVGEADIIVLGKLISGG